MDDISQETSQKPLPFNNLYLIAGLVNGWNKGWMYLCTILFTVLGYFLPQLIMLFPLTYRLINNGYSASAIAEDPNLVLDAAALQWDRNLVLILVMSIFVFAFLGLMIGLRYIHQKTLTSVLTAYQKFRFKRFSFGFLIWAFLIVGFISISYFISPGEFTVTLNWGGLLLSTVIMLVLMPVQTGWEELFFRGYLLQGLSQVFKNGIIPLVLTSLLFGLAHLSNPEVKEHGWKIMLLYYVCFALFIGAITLLDEGIELAFGIHFANNLVRSIFIGTPNSVIKTYSLFETKAEDPNSEILVWFVMAALSFVIFKFRYNWKNFGLIIK